MRYASLILLAACSGSGTDAPNPTDSAGTTDAATDGATTDPATDPRFDQSTWPSTLGGDRPARVVFPKGADWNGEPMPLVFLLHGYSATATVQDLYFGFSARVPERDFVLVLPEGNVDSFGFQYWNATDACCDFDNSNPDDVGYLLGLVDEAEAAFPIDRVVFTGHSNGGFMSHRMACEASDRISAIVSLAGMTFEDEGDCHATEPVAVLQSHGTADETIYYDGSFNYPTAEETIGRWADRAGCVGGHVASGTADFDTTVVADETELIPWGTGCAADVVLWKMNGSGHVPGLTTEWRDGVLDWALAQPAKSE